jgi:hypothetical protein
MCTGQRVGSGAVIECAWLPAAHRVTANTGDVKLAQAMVRIRSTVIFLFMTTLAGSVRALVS